MVTNFILTCLLLFAGTVAALIILFFGIRFCKDGGELDIDSSTTFSKFLIQVFKDFPFWIWIIAFLVFQPCIPQILRLWCPVWWNAHEYIVSCSSCIAFVSFVLYIITTATMNDDTHDEKQLN